MKKSIFKVTAWSVIIGVAIVVSIEKGTNNFGVKKAFTIAQELKDEATIAQEENNNTSSEENQSQSNGIDYNSTAYNNANKEEDLGFASNNATTSNTTSGAAMPVPSADLAYEKTTNNEQISNPNEAVVNEDALAKGGPSSNNSNSFQTQETSTTNAGISAVAPSNASTANAPSSARISSPTIVTNPPNPSGSTSGGSSAGDPYVPIDDYYGLIFLIAVSTIVGVYSLKKSRVV